MLFSSFEFLFRFLPVFLVIYYLTPKKFRNLASVSFLSQNHIAGGKYCFLYNWRGGLYYDSPCVCSGQLHADPFDVSEEYGRAGNQTETLIASCARV